MSESRFRRRTYRKTVATSPHKPFPATTRLQRGSRRWPMAMRIFAQHKNQEATLRVAQWKRVGGYQPEGENPPLESVSPRRREQARRIATAAGLKIFKLRIFSPAILFRIRRQARYFLKEAYKNQILINFVLYIYS